MSYQCLSSTPKTTQFSSLLLSDLHLFFSFILSHPLYFSYLIFFSPYLLKLLSFLSPLFITTSLLLLGFLTLSPGLLHENPAFELPEPKVGFFLWTYHSIVERLRPSEMDNEEDFHHFEDLDVYKIVFDTSSFYPWENSDGVSESETQEICFFDVEEKTVEIDWEETTQPIKEAKRLEGLFKELGDFENMVSNVEGKKIALRGTDFDKVEVQKEVVLVGRGSEEICDKIIRDGAVETRTDNGGENTSKVAGNTQSMSFDSTDNGGEYTSKVFESPTLQTLDSNDLASYGSMTREKESKKTLACMLFEDRQHNVDGGEGMDLLWEEYEVDSSDKTKAKSNNAKKNKNKKKSESEYYYEEDDDEEEVEGIDGQLCCLQALKFSTRKMNLGMGRPNLVKISKAIKGIGWLHHVTRHGKKGNK